MAHPQQLQFVKSIANLIGSNMGKNSTKILEIGSYDVNGSIRSFFINSQYTGVDLTPGPGVDIVSEGDKINHPDHTYDITISCECFEHNPNWYDTFLNMYRLTKNSGLVVFTCATTGRPEHGTTRTTPQQSPGTQSLNWDYYQNLTQLDFENHFDFPSLFKSYFFLTNDLSHDLYFFGRKKESLEKYSTQNIKNFCISDQQMLQTTIQKVHRIEKLIPKPLRKYLRKSLIFFLASRKNSRLISNF